MAGKTQNCIASQSLASPQPIMMREKEQRDTVESAEIEVGDNLMSHEAESEMSADEFTIATSAPDLTVKLFLSLGEHDDAILMHRLLKVLCWVLHALTVALVVHSAGMLAPHCSSHLLTRAFGLVIIDAVSCLFVALGFGVGLLQLLAPAEETGAFLKVVICNLTVDNLVGWVGACLFCSISAIITSNFELTMLWWTCADTVLYSNVSAFFDTQVLNPALWVHYALCCVTVVLSVIFRHSVPLGVTKVTLQEQSFRSLHCSAAVCLLLAHILPLSFVAHPHTYRVLTSSPLPRVLETMVGVIFAWTVILYESDMQVVASVSRRCRMPALILVALLYTLELIQPITLKTPGRPCPQALQRETCLSLAHVCVPRCWILIFIGLGVTVRRARFRCSSTEDMSRAEEVLKTQLESSVFWVQLLSANSVLTWPTSSMVVIAASVMNVAQWMSTNLISIPIIWSVSMLVMWFYSSYAKEMLIERAHSGYAHAYGCGIEICRRVTCSRS